VALCLCGNSRKCYDSARADALRPAASDAGAAVRILVVEDEREMAHLVASLLREAGFVVDAARSLAEAQEAVRQSPYDLALLDRRLPDGDGLRFVSFLRGVRVGARVMMLTALDSLDDTVEGLDAGADDYLCKPFRGPELVARVRACLRRPGGETQPPLVLARISFDLATREFRVDGAPASLHRRELILLEALMRRARRVAPRDILLEEVYGRQSPVQQHTLDTLVWRLRRRLDALNAGVTIHLARGVGYMLTETQL
jgi:two-component system, OmpR family, response regulator